MGSPAEAQHHHRSSKAPHKAFKSRHASKSSVKEVLKGATSRFNEMASCWLMHH